MPKGWLPFRHNITVTINQRPMKILTFLPLLVLLAAAPLRAADAPAPHLAKPPVVKGAKNVSVDEFDKLRADKNAVVLDVRTAKEFNDGHIPGAVNLDFNGPDFAKKVAALDQSKTYLVHCAAGGRSAKACNLMDKIAFTNLVHLPVGFRGWEKAGKPIEKK